MPDGSDATPGILVAVPAFGLSELTDAVLRDLARDGTPSRPDVHVVVVDNAGDYVLPAETTDVSVHRPGRNLRWIGSANWALREASGRGDAVCVVLNNDVRLSVGFLDGLVAAFGAGAAPGAAAAPGAVAVAAACYDDFWLHQRARIVPTSAADYQPTSVVRDVPFCDGTAIAFAVAAVTSLGGLDEVTFPRHGYGSDIDLALRVRAAGLRCVVTEAAYVSHLRRATMTRTAQPAELNRAEIIDGLTAKWGDGWRALAGLGAGSFPPHNTGSAASWYLDPPAAPTDPRQT